MKRIISGKSSEIILDLQKFFYGLELKEYLCYLVVTQPSSYNIIVKSGLFLSQYYVIILLINHYPHLTENQFYHHWKC